MQLAEDGECTGQVAFGFALMLGSSRIHHPELNHPSRVIPNSEIPRLETPLSHCKQTSGILSNREKYELLRERRMAAWGASTGSIAMSGRLPSDAPVASFFAIMRCTEIPPRLLEAKAN